MSILKVSVAQVKAARALLEWSQERLAEASAISLPTIKRLEANGGDLGGRTETGAKIVQALEAAGVEFIAENGGGAGVRLRKSMPGSPDAASLDRQIASQEAKIAGMPKIHGPSPAAGLAAMDKAMAKDELVKLKNARTRRKGSANDKPT